MLKLRVLLGQNLVNGRLHEMSAKSLLLRFSDSHGIDTIASHLQVIRNDGFCWWAKLGKQPTADYLSEFLKQDEKIVFLYTSYALFRCQLGTLFCSIF